MRSSTISESLSPIDCRGVDVSYSMPTVRSNTLKETLLKHLRGQGGTSRHQALANVDFRAERGETVAIIGHNGSGKSTMLKVLAGILTPKAGQVSVRGRIAPLIELGAGFDAELTGEENVYLSCGLLGLSRKETEERIDYIRSFAELGNFFDAPVKTYSSGMYMRLGFSCSVAIDADVLLIDEILAVGDENYQRKCIGKVSEIIRTGVTCVLVSHDLALIRRIASRVVVFDHGKKIFDGDPIAGVTAYENLMGEVRLRIIPEQQRAEEARQRKLAEANANRYEKSATPEETAARIISAKVQGSAVANGLDAAEKLSVVIDIEVRRELADAPVVGFAIHNAGGVRIFGGNNKLFATGSESDAASRRKPGKYRYRYDFEPTGLASGVYHLIAAIHNWPIEDQYDFSSDADKFVLVSKNDTANFDRDVVDVKNVLRSSAVDAIT